MSNMQAYDKYSGYIQLTDQQQKLVDKIRDWFYNSSEQVFQFSGAAGTGKSTVIQAAIKAIGLQANEVAPMSYIGAAAIIMRTKGLWNARTIHSWLYEPFYKDGEYDAYMNRPKKILSFKRKPLPDEIRLVVVDEAGAVPIKLKPEIEGEGRKVLACGDVHQLPPVGNPNPAYLRTGKIEYLTQIMRQASGSSIPYFANDLLHGLRPRHGMYGKNVAVLYDNEIDNNLPLIANQDVILAPSNNTRNEFNDGIRKYILGYESKFPYHGERLVCRKNNWNIEVDGIGLANGLIGKVANYPSVQGFDGKTFSIDFHPNLINGTFGELANFGLIGFNSITQNQHIHSNFATQNLVMNWAPGTMGRRGINDCQVCRTEDYSNRILRSQEYHNGRRLPYRRYAGCSRRQDDLYRQGRRRPCMAEGYRMAQTEEVGQER